MTHRLILVGGGHTHVQVMRALAERPEPGLTVTLVTDQSRTPYSGMLPGHVSGVYTAEEMHIDLARLAAATGVTLVASAAVSLDRTGKQLRLADGAALPYDTLSLNVGIAPDLSGIVGAEAHGLAVKPISRFLPRLEALLEGAARPEGPRRVVVIGGGAAGVELALALRARLAAVPDGGRPFWIGLLAGEGLLPSLNHGVRGRARAALARHRVAVVEGFMAAELNGEGVRAADGRFIEADTALISTAARAPSWLAVTDLPLTPDGFVATEPTLAVVGDPAVFSVGDCGTVVADPRPKAGVFAVRQGPPLTENLRRRARGEPQRPHRAQRDWLTILATGDGSAIAGRGGWLAVEGRWVWRWKDWIDRRFMARFNDFGPR